MARRPPAEGVVRDETVSHVRDTGRQYYRRRWRGRAAAATNVPRGGGRRPRLRDGDDKRKVILVLSDGKDTGPTSFRQRVVSQADVIDRGRREDVMIYGVGMRSRSRSTHSMPPGMGPGGLQAMLLADMPDPGLA